MRRRLGSIALFACVACGPREVPAAPVTAPTPAVATPTRPEPAPPPAAPAPPAPPAVPTPSPPSPGALTLPAPSPPITLRHARALAGAGEHAAAAAVYGALLEASPDDALLRAGRGYCLIFVDGGAAMARSDLVRARELAVGDDRLTAMIEHNLALLDERTGAAPVEEACADHTEAVAPLAARDLLEVAQRLHALLSGTASWDGVEVPLPATAEEASELLCVEPCDTTRPFLVELGPEGGRQFHLVVPSTEGMTVLPGATSLAWWDARCGETLTPTLTDEGGRIHVRSTVIHMEEEEVCEDGECMTGCGFSGRTDTELVARRDGSHAVRLTVEGGIDGDTFRGLRYTIDGETMHVAVCGALRDLPL